MEAAAETIRFDLGVAIAILVVNFPIVALLFVGERRGWIAFGGTLRAKSDEATLWRERFEYVEARRKEERDGRIQAEKRVTVLTEATRDITALLQDVRVELARGDHG